MSPIILIASLLLIAALTVGCTSQPAATPTPIPQSATPTTAPCTDKDCFISAANDCKDLSVTLTEDIGVLKYSSSKGCVFTKTLVSLDSSEIQEMKSALEGKSLTCKYESGKFDPRLVTSLIYGSEYCEGPLKDAFGELLAFT